MGDGGAYDVFGVDAVAQEKDGKGDEKGEAFELEACEDEQGDEGEGVEKMFGVGVEDVGQERHEDERFEDEVAVVRLEGRGQGG